MRLLRGCSAILTALCLLVPVSAGSDTAVVPILMYHHFTLDPTCANGNCITADALEEQLAALFRLLPGFFCKRTQTADGAGCRLFPHGGGAGAQLSE